MKKLPERVFILHTRSDSLCTWAISSITYCLSS